MKKFVFVMLASILLCSLVSCNNPVTSETDGINDTYFDTQEQGAIKLGGVSISEYRIVYAENPKAALYAKYKDVVIQDTEYDEQSAKHLAACIKEKLGIELDVVKDTESEQTEHEINIGVTNRKLTIGYEYRFKSDKSYIIEMKNGSLEVCGSSYGATFRAIDVLVEQIIQSGGLGKTFSKQGEANILILGCIGDSLTNGSKPWYYESSVADADRREIVSYPAVLQRLYWKDMVVYNYGQGGRTMTENFVVDGSDYAYSKSSQYLPCMHKAAELDLVLIMLGTNDANSNNLSATGKNVSSAEFKSEFKQGCTNLVNALKDKNRDIHILILNSPVTYAGYIKTNLDLFVRRYQKNAAEELGLSLIDVYTYTKKNMSQDVFPDALHPTDEGYTILAEGIGTLIKPVVDEILKSGEKIYN